MAPSFFSWLGKGTSRLGLPVAVSGGPWTSCDFWISVAGLADVVEINAEGPARKGRRVDAALATFTSVSGGDRWTSHLGPTSQSQRCS